MENTKEKTAYPAFEELSKQQLKTIIKSKFGNASRFCKLTNRDIYQFNKLFVLKRSPQNDKLLKGIYDDAIKTENATVSGELTERQRKEIKSGIYKESDNILDFCEKNKFRNTWVSTVLGGKVQKITPRVKALAKAAGVKV